MKSPALHPWGNMNSEKNIIKMFAFLIINLKIIIAMSVDLFKNN